MTLRQKESRDTSSSSKGSLHESGKSHGGGVNDANPSSPNNNNHNASSSGTTPTSTTTTPSASPILPTVTASGRNVASLSGLEMALGIEFFGDDIPATTSDGGSGGGGGGGSSSKVAKSGALKKEGKTPKAIKQKTQKNMGGGQSTKNLTGGKK